MIQPEFCVANFNMWDSTYSKIEQEKNWKIRLDCRDGDKITCIGNCFVSSDIAGVQLWVSAWWPFMSYFLGTL